MAYDEYLAERISRIMNDKKVANVAPKKMMGGLTFMVNDKMCVGIVKDELMVRINPDEHETIIQRPSARTMDFTSKPMKGFIFVSPEGVDNEADLESWVQLALDYNPLAKASKKSKKT
jgi:TfoX/Sxy family transcriptional regulator of competence genes